MYFLRCQNSLKSDKNCAPFWYCSYTCTLNWRYFCYCGGVPWHTKKRGVLGAGTTRNRGGLKHVYNPKKGEFRTGFVKREGVRNWSCSKWVLGAFYLLSLLLLVNMINWPGDAFPLSLDIWQTNYEQKIMNKLCKTHGITWIFVSQFLWIPCVLYIYIYIHAGTRCNSRGKMLSCVNLIK